MLLCSEWMQHVLLYRVCGLWWLRFRGVDSEMSPKSYHTNATLRKYSRLAVVLQNGKYTKLYHILFYLAGLNAQERQRPLASAICTPGPPGV